MIEQKEGTAGGGVERMVRELGVVGEATQRALDHFSRLPMASQHEVLALCQERLAAFESDSAAWRQMLTLFERLAEVAAAQPRTEADLAAFPAELRHLLTERAQVGYGFVNNTRGGMLEAIADLRDEACGSLIAEVLKVRGFVTKAGTPVNANQVRNILERLLAKGWVEVTAYKGIRGTTKYVGLTEQGRKRLDAWKKTTGRGAE